MFIFQSNLELVVKPSFSIHILVSFCLLFLYLAICRVGILSSTFPNLWILFFHFWFTINVGHIPWSMYSSIQNKLSTCQLRLAFCSHFFIFFLFLAPPYTLNIKIYRLEGADFFSTTVHVFCNLFLKIYALFGQILITCLKCSRASFLPSSYSVKMHWRWGCPYTNLYLCESEAYSMLILKSFVFCKFWMSPLQIS